MKPITKTSYPYIPHIQMLYVNNYKRYVKSEPQYYAEIHNN